MEEIINQLSEWIEAAINGLQDPDKIFKLRVVRPKVVDWNVTDFKHGDVIMELGNVEPYDITTSSRLWLGEWKLYGIITTLPDGTDADDVLDVMSDLIRSKLLSDNEGRACEGLALNVSCPDTSYGSMAGGVVTEITVNIRF